MDSENFVQELEKIPCAINDLDITGKSAKYVLAIFKSIGNNRDKFRENTTFSFTIKKEKESQTPILPFILTPKPYPNHPDNGFINCLTYDELIQN